MGRTDLETAMGVQSNTDVCSVDEKAGLVCPVCGKPIEKDTKQCPYCKELIWDVEFNEDELGEEKTEKEDYEIGITKGSLSFMLFIIGLSGFWSVLSGLISLDESPFYLALTVLYALLCTYVIVLFKKKKTNAVYVAVSFFVIGVLSNIVALFSDEIMHSAIRIFWNCVWLVFLLTSRGLMRMFPVRKMFWWDWLIVISIVCLLVIEFLSEL